MNILSIAQQDTIQDSFVSEEVVVLESSIEIGSEITFPRLKALVEAIEEYVGTIDPEEE